MGPKMSNLGAQQVICYTRPEAGHMFISLRNDNAGNELCRQVSAGGSALEDYFNFLFRYIT